MARILVRPSRSWSVRDRLLFNCQENDQGCWLWIGAKSRNGYGSTSTGPAHRASYETFVGPIPPGLQIDHLCRTPSCIRPSHLEPVTQRENAARSIPHNRTKTHCKQGHAYSPENTYVTPSGWRRCLECKRAWGREWMRSYDGRKRESV